MFSVYRYVVGSGTQDKAGAKRVRNSLSRGCKIGDYLIGKCMCLRCYFCQKMANMLIKLYKKASDVY